MDEATKEQVRSTWRKIWADINGRAFVVGAIAGTIGFWIGKLT